MKKTEKGMVLTLEFSGYQDLLDTLRKGNQESYARTNLHRPSYCPYTYEQAIETLQSGWGEGTADIGQIAANISESISDAQSYDIAHEVTGDYLDMGRYMSGEPECFGQVVLTETPEKTVHLLINIGYSCAVSTAQVYNRGAAITSLIEELRKTHFVKVSLYHKVTLLYQHPYDEIFITYIEVSLENDFSRDLLAFYLAHPGFLRRLIMSITDDFAPNIAARDHGYPKDLDLIPGDAIHFPKLESTDRQWDTLESAIRTVKVILAKQ